MRASMGKKDGNIITETASYIKKEVGAVERNLEKRAKQIAVTSTIFGTALGIVIGIVGVSLWERYVTPPAAPPSRPSTQV